MRFIPKTLAEEMDFPPECKPLRVYHDEIVDADFCPYCEKPLQNDSTEETACPFCHKPIAWY